MNNELLDRLQRAIGRYEQGKYQEHDFHSTLESIIPTITEEDLRGLRDSLTEKEGDLEKKILRLTKGKEKLNTLK